VSPRRTRQGWRVRYLLIAQLLGLFLAFLGEATTLRLIEDLRLQFDDATESEGTAAETADPEVAALVLAAAFGDLLREIDRLRSVSEHIENLADNHPGWNRAFTAPLGVFAALLRSWTFSHSSGARLAARKKMYRTHKRVAI